MLDLKWSVIEQAGYVILRCKPADMSNDQPWWHVAEILPQGLLRRCSDLAPDLGFDLNNDDQIKDYDFEGY